MVTCHGMIEVSEIAPQGTAEAETPHGFLRRVTRPWHDGVEQAFEPFDLQTAEGLRGFLLRQATALVPFERALEASGVEGILPDWTLRRRAAMVESDLAHLGASAPVHDPAPRCESAAMMLGALYVLEGSKLGGRVLHRRVLASPDPRVRAAIAFLGHRHDRSWPSFLAVLDGWPLDHAARDELAQGAHMAFAAFRAAAESDGMPASVDTPTRFDRYHPAHA